MKEVYKTKALPVRVYKWTGKERVLNELPAFISEHPEVNGLRITPLREGEERLTELVLDCVNEVGDFHTSYIAPGGILVLNHLGEFSTYTSERFRQFYK